MSARHRKQSSPAVLKRSAHRENADGRTMRGGRAARLSQVLAVAGPGCRRSWLPSLPALHWLGSAHPADLDEFTPHGLRVYPATNPSPEVTILKWDYDMKEIIADGIVHAVGVTIGTVSIIALLI